MRRRRHVQGHDEPEGAAGAGLAFHPDLAAHQGDQALADGQPQAAAAIAAGGRAIGLGEGAEQGGDGVGGNADAAVGHRETQRHPVRPGPGDGADIQHHTAGLGELDGVTQQVQQHLLQAQAVTHHHHRRVGRDGRRQGELLFIGVDRHQRHQPVHQVGQFELGVFKIQLPRLHLREVEDVVDQRHQAAAGRGDLGDEVPLLRGQPGVRQQLGQAQDGVHRRADFMTHIGQEIGFRPAGRFGGGLGRDQGGLAVAHLGDVPVHADDADGPAVGVPVGDRGALHMAYAAVGPHHPEFRVQVGAPIKHAPELRRHARRIVRLAMGPPDGEAVGAVAARAIELEHLVVPIQAARGHVVFPDGDAAGLGGQGQAR
ncbi:hypothetical protein AZA_21720 [Nitrospirillum viridazoti Y2]|nr:hypothetical protein AZA_21720 [Nitrospirillum amazonense Y2]